MYHGPLPLLLPVNGSILEMSSQHFARTLGLFARTLGLTTVAATLLVTAGLRAADRTFVGVLALAVEVDVAREVGLDEPTRQKLRGLVQDREDAAIQLALSIKNLPDAEKNQRLAEFAAESERQGFELLSAEQGQRLRQIRVARDGPSTLAEAAIADQLKLTDDQRSKIAQLLEQRSEALKRGGEEDRRITRLTYERQLMAVLNQEQRAGWERLAGLAAVEPGDNPAASPAEPAEPTSDEAPGAAPADSDTAEAAPAAPADSESAEGPAAPPADTAMSEGSTPEKPAPSGPESPEAAGQSPADTARTEPAAEAEVLGESDLAAQENEAPTDVRLRFNFRYAPWKDVLDWFADQAGLSLVLDAPPAGTFNYTDARTYTPAQAIDLLNSVLLTKGFTLVRRERMLMLINLEDGIPPNLVTRVSLEELDKVGDFELVSCLFQLEKMTSEEAQAEIAKLLGPQGSVVTLPKAKQVLVTETGGRLRTIQRVIERIEQPVAEEDRQVVTLPLQHVTAEEVLVVARQLLGLPEEQNAAPDGSIRIAVDPLGTKFFVTGDAKAIERFSDILKLVDVPVGFDVGEGGVAEPPQMAVYSVTDADPTAVLQVMQTLMAGLPDVRLASDSKTGNLIVLARPSQHATIKATLDEMQRDASQVEVIRLRVVDPQLAVLSINKLFGGGGEEGEGGRNAPLVDADPVTRQLLIRGTGSQVEQIRTLLQKMGETESNDGAIDQANREKFRRLPILGANPEDVLGQAQQLWPSMRPNRIRVMTPTRSIRAIRPGAETNDDIGFPAFPGEGGFQLLPRSGGRPSTPPDKLPDASPESKAAPADRHRPTRHRRRQRPLRRGRAARAHFPSRGGRDVASWVLPQGTSSCPRSQPIRSRLNGLA